MKVRYLLILLVTVIPINSNINAQKKKMLPFVDSTLGFCVNQYKQMAVSLANQPDKLPRTFDKNGKLVTCKPNWWVSGFFPGSLWYLYEFSKGEEMKNLALDFTSRVKDQQYTTDNHDVGFMIYCSFGNGYRILGDTDYKRVILNAAASLSTRFKPAVGCIRSWDWGKWQYPVIIDNMMNLELLYFASKNSDIKKYEDIANSHAHVTLANHFRPDGSCYHVVSYDTITGKAIVHETRQGFANESAWARGQAWALYGYTMCYRETRKPEYLEQAKKVAAFILHNPNLPADKVPYWDFNDTAIPNTVRDASSAAIMCSALIELSGYVNKKLKKEYMSVAETQIKSLSSPAYLAKPGENGNFILMHSTGSKPENSEVDVPLTYADYYFIEALMRYRNAAGSVN